MLRNAMGCVCVCVCVCSFPEKSYDGVRFNGISVTRGWVGV